MNQLRIRIEADGYQDLLDVTVKDANEEVVQHIIVDILSNLAASELTKEKI